MAATRTTWILFRENEAARWFLIGLQDQRSGNKMIRIERSRFSPSDKLYIPDEHLGAKGMIVTGIAASDSSPTLHINGKNVFVYDVPNSDFDGTEDYLTIRIPSSIAGKAADGATLLKIAHKCAHCLKVDLSQSDPTFILIKQPGRDNDKALYIGTSSYIDKIDHKWPGSNQWQKIEAPDGKLIEVYSPEASGPEIQIHTAGASFLSRLRLLENTKYSWAILSGKTGESISRSVTSEEEATVTWGSTDQELDREGKSLGTFNFKNFLGTAEVKKNGSPLAHLESTSLKIGYEDEYLRMLHDLTNEALDNILNHASITSAHLRAGSLNKKDNAFGKFILLQASLPIQRLTSSYAIIRSQPHTELQSSFNWLPAWAANGSYAMRNPIARIRWAKAKPNRDNIRKYQPGEALENKRVESHDTPPNRFARHALVHFINICEAIYEAKGRYGERHASVARSYAEECRRLLRTTMLASCGDINRIPIDNQVLQKRIGYREVFRSWSTSNLGLRIKELADQGLLSPKAENRDAPKLYELWLISHLKKAMKELSSGKKAIHESLPYQDKDQIELYRTTAEPLYIIETENRLLIALYYNRSFAAKPAKNGRQPSYSVELKPDYTLEIIQPSPKPEIKVTNLKSYVLLRNMETSRPELGGSTTYIHFDAKFRINNIQELSEDDPTKAKPGDIYKMHTYNEAIYGTATSIILYPGNSPASYRKFNDLVPGVSALAIKPDKAPTDLSRTDNSISNLKEIILKILAELPQGDEARYVEEPKHLSDYSRIRFAETLALRSNRKSADA